MFTRQDITTTVHSVTNIPRGALDTCGRENSVSKWIRVGVEIFEAGNKQLWIRKYPDTYGGGPE